jgi:hypothetical protein
VKAAEQICQASNIGHRVLYEKLRLVRVVVLNRTIVGVHVLLTTSLPC